jgi:hypothetical protein
MRERRRYDRFSTHSLLLSDLLDREPADRVFFTLGCGHGPLKWKNLSTPKASER